MVYSKCVKKHEWRDSGAGQCGPAAVRRQGACKLLAAALVAWAVGAPAALGTQPADSEISHFSALLVGNSYTRFNLLPVLVQRLAEGVPGGPTLKVDAVAYGGYTLRRHWRRKEAQVKIRDGGYTHVVLQDHSMRPIDRAREMASYVARFDGLIDAVGAKTVLYETWARRAGAKIYRKRPDLRSPQHMQDKVGGAYRSLAKQRQTGLAPVGTVFLRALQARPDLPLYLNDGAHPSFHGSYLAACVLYQTITGADPRRSTYSPYELSARAAREIREVAASNP